jgi:serine/threonine protein kinase
MLSGGDERVRLIDFGLATIADLAAKHQTLTRIAGSPGYMAPEQFSGQPSAATDIYSFGVIAYKLITGRKPFVAEDVMQLSMLQRSGVKVKPAALRPGISGQTEKLILHALNYNPLDRPASASAYGEALSQALLSSQSNPSIVMVPPSPNRLRLAWIAGGLAVFAIAAGAVWMYRGRTVAAPPPPPPVSGVAVVHSDPGEPVDAVELAFWNSIGSSSDPRLYAEYLGKYPNGKFSSLARLKLQVAPAVKPSDAPPHPVPGALPAQSAPASDQPAQPAPVPLSKAVLSPQSNLPALRSVLKPEEYSGPLRGNLIWNGSLNPDSTLTIQAGKAATGNLLGDLPRVPVTVDILGVGANIVEQPSAVNQFDRIVLRNVSSTPIRALVIRWRVAK